jgi:hypothetical protein
MFGGKECTRAKMEKTRPCSHQIEECPSSKKLVIGRTTKTLPNNVYISIEILIRFASGTYCCYGHCMWHPWPGAG